MPSSHLILCRPLLLLPPIPPSIRVFSNESILHMRWPKYWSFSFSISPSKEIPGLISFGMDWLALLAVQGTLKSLLQHHSPKASILRRSAFFTVQLSHPCMTTIRYYKVLHFARRLRASQVALVVKNPPDNAGNIINMGLISGWGRSLGGGHMDLLQHSCLENPMDREEPGRLQSTGSHRVRHNWSDFVCVHAHTHTHTHRHTQKTELLLHDIKSRKQLYKFILKFLSLRVWSLFI